MTTTPLTAQEIRRLERAINGYFASPSDQAFREVANSTIAIGPRLLSMLEDPLLVVGAAFPELEGVV